MRCRFFDMVNLFKSKLDVVLKTIETLSMKKTLPKIPFDISSLLLMHPYFLSRKKINLFECASIIAD